MDELDEPMSLIAARMCGRTRTDGGIYMESGLDADGLPLEFFLIDPPIHELKGTPILQALNLTPRGVQVLEWKGVPHVFDVVGADSYPDVLDFYNETKALGASRRCELPASEYAKLIPGQSRMLLIHPKAMILNHAEIWGRNQAVEVECPKSLAEHETEPPQSMCAGLWKIDLTVHDGLDYDATVVEDWPSQTTVKRKLPCGKVFSGVYQNTNAPDPQYAPALFLSLPITNLVLVDPTGKHTAKRTKLEGSRLDWKVSAE